MGVLSYRGVSKRFGEKLALLDVSLEVEPGEVFGLLGPNGAGKTTLIRIAFDILRPDSGDVRLFGQPLRRELLDRVSYLPEERGVYRKATTRDLLSYFGRLKGMAPKAAREAADRWLAKVGLEAAADLHVEALSKGMTQKVQIAGALMTEPEFCVLDEPFSGLDPVNVAMVKALILERRSEGKSTVLSTHLMHQVEALCDRVALIHEGRLVVYGALAEIRRKYSHPEVLVRSQREPLETSLTETVHHCGNGDWRVRLHDDAEPYDYLRQLVDAGLNVDRFEPLVATMDDIFLQVVGDGGPL